MNNLIGLLKDKNNQDQNRYIEKLLKLDIIKDEHAKLLRLALGKIRKRVIESPTILIEKSESEKRADEWVNYRDATTLEIIKARKITMITDVNIIVAIINNPRIFNDSQRTKIYLRDEATCQLCGTFVTIGNYDCDHIIPYSLGGETTLENGQCTCKTCNRSKGNRQ